MCASAAGQSLKTAAPEKKKKKVCNSCKCSELQASHYLAGSGTLRRCATSPRRVALGSLFGKSGDPDGACSPAAPNHVPAGLGATRGLHGFSILPVHGLKHACAPPDRLCTVKKLQRVRVGEGRGGGGDLKPLCCTFYPPAHWTLAGACAVAIFLVFIEECLALCIATEARIGHARMGPCGGGGGDRCLE